MGKKSMLFMIFLMVFSLSACRVDKDISSQVATPAETEVKNDDKGIFIGDKIYDFTLKDMDNNDITLSSLQGKVVFLNFWTTWCPPCKSEMAHMQKVYEEANEENVVMIAVNLTKAEKNGKQGVIKFIEEKGYTFPVVFDVKGDIIKKFSITDIPTTYVINREGIISSFIKAPLDVESIERELKKAME